MLREVQQCGAGAELRGSRPPCAATAPEHRAARAGHGHVPHQRPRCLSLHLRAIRVRVLHAGPALLQLRTAASAAALRSICLWPGDLSAARRPRSAATPARGAAQGQGEQAAQTRDARRATSTAAALLRSTSVQRMAAPAHLLACSPSRPLGHGHHGDASARAGRVLVCRPRSSEQPGSSRGSRSYDRQVKKVSSALHRHRARPRSDELRAQAQHDSSGQNGGATCEAC
jgi:hypothetical protein